MTETITLHTTPDKYDRCFPNAWFSPPDGVRSSEPGDIVQAVHMMDGHYFAKEAEWGFIPPKRTFAGKPITYAEGATITRRHRTSIACCVVPASHFTFLREVDGVTMRYKLARRDRGLMLLAGIMEPNPPRIGGAAATVALITTRPNRMLAPHGLPAPLMLEHGQVEPWLRHSTKINVVKRLMQPPADLTLKLTIYFEPAAEPALA